MSDGLNEQRRGQREDIKSHMEQSLRTAGVLAVAILIFLSLYLLILYF